MAAGWRPCLRLSAAAVLSEQDLQELESTLLPALERHHLRLLAHSLRCLQQAAEGSSMMPAQAGLMAWAQQQPNLAVDPTFIPVLVEQLAKAAVQLELIGLELHKPPLELEISDLVRWGQQQADQRISDALKPPEHEPRPGQAAPPTTPANPADPPPNERMESP